MEKGQAAVLLIAVVVIGILVFVVFQNLPRGGGGVSTRAAVKDPVQISEYVVSRNNPSVGSSAAISFIVTNNGKRKVDVEINFFDTQGLQISKVACNPDCDGSGNIFALRELENLESRPVSVTLTVPAEDKIISPEKRTVKFLVSYDYTSYREAIIPILQSLQVKPTIKFTQSEPSDGPVTLEFEPPVGGQVTQGGQTSNLAFALKDQSFELTMKLKHIGTAKNVKLPMEISARNFNLELVGLGVVENQRCDFDFSGSTLTPKKDLKVPGTDLVCNFKSTDFEESQIQSQVKAQFAYKYQFQMEQQFQVQPIKQE